MTNTNPLRRKYVKKEVKRIKKLPEYERKRQMDALSKRVCDEIESTCARIDNDQHGMGERRKEARRLLYCVMAFPKDYRKSIYKIWDKAFHTVLVVHYPDKVNNTEKVNSTEKIKTAHVSGLPLPEQAEVYVWWQKDKLIFATEATEFSLPAERVMGMGTTGEVVAATLGGQKTYFSIEYKKENEIKHIVVRVTYRIEVRVIIDYFNQIKRERKTNRREL